MHLTTCIKEFWCNSEKNEKHKQTPKGFIVRRNDKAKLSVGKKPIFVSKECLFIECRVSIRIDQFGKAVDAEAGIINEN